MKRFLNEIFKNFVGFYLKMARPKLCRRVSSEPNITYFKPAGVRLLHLEDVKLNVDELEAIKLKDFFNLDQKEAAERMKVSQPTMHRLLQSARRKIAEALVKGKAIRIEGGNYKLEESDRRFRCCSKNKKQRRNKI